jgi:hypothetical protein
MKRKLEPNAEEKKESDARRLEKSLELVGNTVHGIFGFVELEGLIRSYDAATRTWRVRWIDDNDSIFASSVKTGPHITTQISARQMKVLHSRGPCALQPYVAVAVPAAIPAHQLAANDCRQQLLLNYRKFLQRNVLPLKSCEEAYVILFQLSRKLVPEVNSREALSELDHLMAAELNGARARIYARIVAQNAAFLAVANSRKELGAVLAKCQPHVPGLLIDEYPDNSQKGLRSMLASITLARGGGTLPGIDRAYRVANPIERFQAAQASGTTHAATVSAFHSERSQKSTGLSTSARTMELKWEKKAMGGAATRAIMDMPLVMNTDIRLPTPTQKARSRAIVSLRKTDFEVITIDSDRYHRNLQLSLDHELPGSTDIKVDCDTEHNTSKANRQAEDYGELALAVTDGPAGELHVAFDSCLLESTGKDGAVGASVGSAFGCKVRELDGPKVWWHHFRGTERQLLISLGVAPDRIIDDGQTVAIMLGAKANGRGSPIELSMDHLAYLLGYRQLHGAASDCATQRMVMALLLEAYRDLSEEEKSKAQPIVVGGLL